MVARVHQQSSAANQLPFVSAAMDGEVLSVLNQLINAKANHVIMAERVNRELDGFGAPVLKDSRDQIVASMLMNAHHNHAWEVPLALMALVVSLAFAPKDDVA